MVKARAIVKVNAPTTVQNTKSLPSSITRIFADNELLLCSAKNCEAKVAARCTICKEHCCYDHAFLHRHSMESFEIIN